MHSDPIEIADDSTAEAPGLGQCFGPFASPAHEREAAREPTPVGRLTLGIAWLFGLEALFGDERR